MAKILYMTDPSRVQLLIPPALVAPEGAMSLTAECRATVGELPDQERVDYDNWQDNIRDGRDPPPKPTIPIGSFSAKDRRVARDYQV